MDKQAIYNQVRDHLLKQNAQSRLPSRASSFGEIQGVCAYRGQGGKMCAVGCLIKDKFYSNELENKPCIMPEIEEAIDRSIGPTESGSYNLLYDLQNVHDSTAVAFWPSALKEVAIKHNLIP